MNSEKVAKVAESISAVMDSAIEDGLPPHDVITALAFAYTGARSIVAVDANKFDVAFLNVCAAIQKLGKDPMVLGEQDAD